MELKENIYAIRKHNPVILNITNYVTMDFVANVLLSIGASPIMSYAKEELEELINIASAVVINIGTLDKNFIDLCNHAATIANFKNKPLIFDPVGVGATKYRTNCAREIIEQHKISIIRGNASEIMALANYKTKTRGVESTTSTDMATEAGNDLAQSYGATILISGPKDIIIGQGAINSYEYGSNMMTKITGMGCALTSVVAAFHAINNNSFEAAENAAIFYGKTGEKAEKNSSGPGSFRLHFLDYLHETE